MKLGVKLAGGLAVLILALAGTTFWLLNSRLERSHQIIDDLHVQLDRRGEREAKLAQQEASAKAGQTSTDAAKGAAKLLADFVRDKEAELNDLSFLKQLTAGVESQRKAATALLVKSKQPLDQVVVTDARGRVTAVAPADNALVGQPYLKAEELTLFRERADPRFQWKILDDGRSRALTVSARFRSGPPKRKFLGVIVATAALKDLLKPAVEQAAAALPSEPGLPRGTGQVQLLIIDRHGDIVFAPSPELVGTPFAKSAEFRSLAAGPEGAAVVVSYNLERWIAYKLRAKLGMTVIGLTRLPTISPPVTSAEGGRPRPPGPPLLLLGGAVLLVVALAGVLVVLPLRRLKDLSQAAQDLAAGAAAGEIKHARAKDEIGELARSLGELGDQLAEQRGQREQAEQSHAQLQKELQESQDQVRALTDEKSALKAQAENEQQEKGRLEGELQSSRTEAVGVRTQLATSEAAVQERDASLAALNAQAKQGQEELAALQQSLTQQAAELTSTRSELEKRSAAPVVGFMLMSEASDALTVEVSSLLDLIQGYVGQIVESAGGVISDEQQEFLSSVINRAARSQRMLGDLRDFTNVSKPGGLAMEPVELVPLLQDVVATMQLAAEDKGVELVSELPSSLPACTGDEPRLRQLFTVILQNAVRFTPEGGRVSLSLLQKEGTAGIKIEDGAEAIPLKSDEVFGHFHSTEEEILELRGSGLRYPVLRTIAELHGGALDLAINEQGGNLFFIRLPLRVDAPSATETADIFAGVPSEPSAPPTLVPAPEASLEPTAALDLSAVPDVAETTETIMAAEPDLSVLSAEPAGIPDAPAVETADAPPTLDLLEAAPASLEPAPASLEPEAPPKEEPEKPSTEAPPPSFTFGSDEVIQE